MILGPISFLDCLAFVLFLIPQLLIQIPLTVLVPCLLRVLPFLGALFSGVQKFSIDSTGSFCSPFYPHTRKILVAPREKVALRTPCIPFPGHRDSMRSVCLRKDSGANRTSLLLKMGFLPVHAFSYASTRHCEVARLFRGGATGRHLYGLLCILLTASKYNFKALWITPDRFARNDIAIFYCHGAPMQHWRLLMLMKFRRRLFHGLKLFLP